MIRIKHNVIEQIKENKQLKKAIEDQLGFIESKTLRRWLTENKDNGPLTRIGVLLLLQAYLKQDWQDLLIVDDDDKPRLENMIPKKLNNVSG